MADNRKQPRQDQQQQQQQQGHRQQQQGGKHTGDKKQMKDSRH
jgi:hypothetical protein